MCVVQVCMCVYAMLEFVCAAQRAYTLYDVQHILYKPSKKVWATLGWRSHNIVGSRALGGGGGHLGLV